MDCQKNATCNIRHEKHWVKNKTNKARKHLFSEKKLKYNTVQLHVYKEEHIHAWWIIYTYKKNIFDMKNKFNNYIENIINLHCCIFKIYIQTISL